MPITLDDLYATPDHYLHSFDGDSAIFVPMSREAYHRSIFLDGRIAPAGQGSMRLPVAAVAPGVRPAQPIGWIFHVAHCGSTLLARALDRPATNLVLREPLALRQLALAPNGERLAIVAAMLGKRYRPELPTLVKANVPVNFLLPQLAAMDPRARAVLLHLSLRDYLAAILRSDNHRDWLRNVTGQLALHLSDLSGASDAERAAALWLAQRRAHADAIARWPDARSLDAERFFAEPRETLAAAAAHLQVPLTPAEIDEIVGGPLFATYSKNPAVMFDNAARLERRRALDASLAGEVAAAERWLEKNAADDAGQAIERAALVG